MIKYLKSFIASGLLNKSQLLSCRNEAKYSVVFCHHKYRVTLQKTLHNL